jgi:hypothetical protein
MNINAPIPLKSVTDEELAMAGVDIQFQARWENEIVNPLAMPLPHPSSLTN